MEDGGGSVFKKIFDDTIHEANKEAALIWKAIQAASPEEGKKVINSCGMYLLRFSLKKWGKGAFGGSYEVSSSVVAVRIQCTNTQISNQQQPQDITSDHKKPN